MKGTRNETPMCPRPKEENAGATQRKRKMKRNPNQRNVNANAKRVPPGCGRGLGRIKPNPKSRRRTSTPQTRNPKPETRDVVPSPSPGPGPGGVDTHTHTHTWGRVANGQYRGIKEGRRYKGRMGVKEGRQGRTSSRRADTPVPPRLDSLHALPSSSRRVALRCVAQRNARARGSKPGRPSPVSRRARV